MVVGLGSWLSRKSTWRSYPQTDVRKVDKVFVLLWLQRAVVQAFEGCTIISIAHRIPTIIGFDRVLVMDAGHAAELASPRTLLDDPTSIFSGLVAEYKGRGSHAVSLNNLDKCGFGVGSPASSASEWGNASVLRMPCMVSIHPACIRHVLLGMLCGLRVGTTLILDGYPSNFQESCFGMLQTIVSICLLQSSLWSL